MDGVDILQGQPRRNVQLRRRDEQCRSHENPFIGSTALGSGEINHPPAAAGVR